MYNKASWKCPIIHFVKQLISQITFYWSGLNSAFNAYQKQLAMQSEADETGTRYRHNLSKLPTSFHSIIAALKVSVSFHFW